MNAIILCGGLSTRLGDITKSIPKILVDVGGRSVLDWQLQKLEALGIDRVVLAAGHLADVLQKEVGEERGGTRLAYAIEKERLGTGGAIKNALGYMEEQDAPTIILNGDVLTATHFPDIVSRLRQGSEGMLLGSRVEDASSYGMLISDGAGRLTEFREKEGITQPGYINGGVYLFTPHAHKYFPDAPAFSIEYDVFPCMQDLDVYRSDEPWVDIGVPERLQWARENWKLFL